MATLTTKQLTAQLADVQAQLAALQPKRTPFTPAGAMLRLLQSTLDPKAKFASWKASGSAGQSFGMPDPNNPTALPVWKAGKLVFNNSPLLGYLGALDSFTVAVVVDLPTLDQDSVLVAQGDLYGFRLGLKGGYFTASYFQGDGDPLLYKAQLGINLVMFSRDASTNLVRLSVNGFPSQKSRDFHNAPTAGGQLRIGGYRTSDGKLHDGFTGSLLELNIFGQQAMPLSRKVEGYARVTYGVTLPDNHYFASKAPVVEPVDDAALAQFTDASGSVLEIDENGVLKYKGPYSYAYTKLDEVFTWVDGDNKAPLRIDQVDPRVQGEVGSKLYTVAYSDEGDPRYFTPRWKRGGKIDLRVFDVTSSNPNCSPAYRAVSEYFPENWREDFYLKPRTAYYFNEGLTTFNRGHWLWGDSINRKPTIVVPAGVVGVSSLCRNGINGMGMRYVRVEATGKDPKDNPVPATNPLLGFLAGDYAYKLQWHGFFADSYIDFDLCEFSGFSGMTGKIQAYIDKNNPDTSNNRNASNSRLFRISASECWGGLLINGADANAIDTDLWDVRDCPGISLIDDSLEGGRHKRWTSHSVKMGHYMVRQPTNSATLTDMYGEVQWFAPGDPAAAFHGSYVAGSASVFGGVLSPVGSGRPGSPVWRVGKGSQILVGSYSSGLNVGDQLLLNGQPVAYANPQVATHADIATKLDGYGNPYIWQKSQVVDVADAGLLLPPAYRCLVGGRFLPDQPSIPVTFLEGGGSERTAYRFALDKPGTVPIPGDSIYLTGVGGWNNEDKLGPFLITGSDQAGQWFYIAPGADAITNINWEGGKYLLDYARPVFAPTGGYGRGTKEQRDALQLSPDAIGWEFLVDGADHKSIYTLSGWV